MPVLDKLFVQARSQTTTTPTAEKNHDTLRANWKCMLACILVSMCPFQYGLDLGMISGLQGKKVL